VTPVKKKKKKGVFQRDQISKYNSINYEKIEISTLIFIAFKN